MLCSWNLSAQTEKIIKNSKKDLVEVFDNPNLENINHELIIKSKISDLITKYWLEKAKDLVREHSLIELNKYKQWEKYKLNNMLTTASEKHAEDMAKNNYFRHTNLKWESPSDRVNKIWVYEYKYLWENMSNDDKISDIILSYVNSQKWWHEEIFNEKYNQIWIWFYPIENNNTYFVKYLFVFDYWK